MTEKNQWKKMKENISKRKENKICSRCKKNKATINFTQSIMDFTHGFVEHICQECYNKIRDNNPWYKEGKKQAEQEFKTEGYRKRIFGFGYNQALEDMKRLIDEISDLNFTIPIKKKLKEQIDKLKNK